MKKKEYKKKLYKLQVELVKFQNYVIKKNLKVCVILEGRDTAGKDGTIKRFIEHLSPRDTRIVALGKPNEKDKKSWYFQRYVPHLPSGGEMVFFNRSWYNRAGVEIVMGFCSIGEHKAFLKEVNDFEALLTNDKMIFIKYYLDISKKEQKKRLKERKIDPLKQWKLSQVDQKALALWNKYSKARDIMFNKTSTVNAPWFIVHTNNKKEARINTIKHFLSQVDYPNKKEELLVYEHNVVCQFDPICYEKGVIFE